MGGPTDPHPRPHPWQRWEQNPGVLVPCTPGLRCPALELQGLGVTGFASSSEIAASFPCSLQLRTGPILGGCAPLGPGKSCQHAAPFQIGPMVCRMKLETLAQPSPPPAPTHCPKPITGPAPTRTQRPCGPPTARLRPRAEKYRGRGIRAAPEGVGEASQPEFPAGVCQGALAPYWRRSSRPVIPSRSSHRRLRSSSASRSMTCMGRAEPATGRPARER